MQHHVSGTEFTAWGAIAVVLACAIGLVLVAVRDGLAARAYARRRPVCSCAGWPHSPGCPRYRRLEARQ
jgi:hypothetical protein